MLACLLASRSVFVSFDMRTMADDGYPNRSGKAQTWHADKKGAFFKITNGPKDFNLGPVAGKGNPPTYA